MKQAQPTDTATTASQPSLPQNDTLLEKAERVAQIELSRVAYGFEHWPGVAMPMGTTSSSVAELPGLGRWLRGQAENLLKIGLDLELWKILRGLGHTAVGNEAKAEAMTGERLAGAMNTGLLAQLKQEPKHQEGTLGALEDLAARIMATTEAHGVAAQESSDTLDSIPDYAKVFTTFSVPPITGSWQSDRIFASQRLAGLNPMAINRVTLSGEQGVGWPDLKARLSPKVTDATVSHFLPGDTLDAAVDQGRLFVCDYAALSTITADPDAVGVFAGKRPMAPIVLYVNSADFPGLELAAIQMDQGIADVDRIPVFLAADAGKPGNADRWLMARQFVQAADLSYNQAVNHLGMTHLLEEAFAIATHRNLAKRHPLYILFAKHFAALLVINELGKLTLLKTGPKGLINQLLETGIGGQDGTSVGATALIAEAYTDWTFDDLDFMKDIGQRGMDAATLPYFPYRDDGELIWNVLGGYAKDYVALYYGSDQDVIDDYELQAWGKDLRGAGNVRGLPTLDSVQALTTVVHRLLWTAGPQHAAVNFPQIDYTTFVPNEPGAPYYEPQDFQDGAIDGEQLLACLPGTAGTTVQVQVSYTLAGFHYDALLDYADELYGDAATVCRAYFDELRGTVTTTIEQRNRTRAGQAGLLPYPYFLPQNIPNSTSV